MILPDRRRHRSLRPASRFSLPWRRMAQVSLAASIAGLLGGATAQADLFWDATALDSAWGTLGNWSTLQTGTTDPAAIPGATDIANFVASNVTALQNINLNGTQSVLGLATNASNTFMTTLQGGGTDQVLNLGGSGINHVGGGLTIGSVTSGQQVSISLQGSQTWTSSTTGTGAFGIQILNGVSIGAGGNQTLTLAGTNTAPQIFGAISDGAAVLSLAKEGVAASTWILSGANSYSGSTAINGGAITIANNTALGTAAGATTVAANAALNLQNNITVTGEALTIAGNGTGASTGALRNLSGNNTWTGNITIGAAAITRIASDLGILTISGNITLTSTSTDQFVLQGVGGGVISGNISGSSRLTRGTSGSGTWVLSGANTYTGGTTISGGTLQFAKVSALYNGDTSKWIASSGATVGLAVASGTTLALSVGGTNEFSTTDLATLLNGSHLGASTGSAGLLSGSFLGLDTTNAAGGVFTYAGNITNAGSNSIGLTKLGTNTLELSGTNTYTGATSLASGTLVISGTLGATTLTTAGSTVLQLRNTAALTTGALIMGGGTLQLRSDTNNDTFAATAITIANTANIDVDRLSTGTGNTLKLGAINLSAPSSATLTISNTGGNGYGLALGAINQSATGGTTFTVANSIPLSMGGFSTSSTSTPKLSFTGSGTVTITGNLTQNASGALALERTTTNGTVILQGSSNMTGAVSITNGTIQTAVSNAFGSTSGISIGGSGTLALRGDTSTTFGNGVTPYPVTLTASGATINVDRSTTAGTGQTLTLGSVTMGGAYTLNVTGANQTSLALGAITGSTANNKVITNSISGGGSLSILSYTETDASARTVTFNGSGNTSVTGAIAQNGANALGLIYSGNGTLTLGNANTYTGTTTVSSGTVSTSSVVVNAGASGLGNATSAVVLGSAGKGILSYTGTSDTYTRGFSVGTTNGEVDVTTSGQTLTIGTGGVAINTTGAFTVGGAGNTTITSAITGTGGGRLIKNDAGTLTLSGANNHSGGTTLNAGTLNVNSTTALGTGTLTINGGTLNNTSGAALVHAGVFNKVIGGSFSFGDSGSTSANDLTLGPTATNTGSITINTNVSATVGGSASLFITGYSVVGGTNTLTKLGTGTLALGAMSNADFQTGTLGDVTVSAGTLIFSLGGATAPVFNLGNASIAASSTLGLGSGNGSTVVTFKLNALTGAGTVTTDNTLTTGLTRRTLQVGTNNGSGTFSGTITDASVTDGTITLLKAGTGIQTLTGTSTYTGNTVINAGTLLFGKTSALYNGDALKWVAKASTISTLTTQGLYVASGATLGLSVGGSGEFTAANVTTLLDGSHLGASSGTIGLQSGSAIGFDTSNASLGVFTYGVAITNLNAGANLLGVTKLGTNALELSATNTYTGATTVKSGTLFVSGSLSGSSTVTVGDSANLGTSAVLGGSGTVGNVIVGAASGNSGATLRPHAGSSSTSAGTTFNAGAVTFTDNSAHLSLQLGRSAVFTTGVGTGATGGDVSDHLKTTGAVTLNGADLQLSLLTTTYSAAEGDVFFLILNGSGSAVNGTFASLNGSATGLGEGAVFNFNSQLFQITYLASFGTNSFSGGNDVALMVVPEPGTWVTLLGGLGMLLGLQRRRKS